MPDLFVETVRYLCDSCQDEWVTVKDEPCESCYEQEWDYKMRRLDSLEDAAMQLKVDEYLGK